MPGIDRYLEAATRENTRRSYQSAIRHFEVEWGGVLPASADAIARYLADHAQSLSVNTLKARLTALAQWHQTQGFPDPTKTPHVRKVLKGIAALHPIHRALLWHDREPSVIAPARVHGSRVRIHAICGGRWPIRRATCVCMCRSTSSRNWSSTRSRATTVRRTAV